MHTALKRYKDDLAQLIKKGKDLLLAIQYECFPSDVEKQLTKQEFENFKKNPTSFKDEYQTWYSEAQTVIEILLPNRLADFVELYAKPKGRKNISHENYVIRDYLQGLVITKGSGLDKETVVGLYAAIPAFRQQLNILKSVDRRLESSLFDIKQLVQADLLDSELEEAHELARNGFFRAAGAICGVVLEKHLAQVCSNHKLSIKKKNPVIADFNDALKNGEVIDTPQWRKIQHLGDLRNLCDHNKGREPQKEEIDDLINGVAGIIKNIF